MCSISSATASCLWSNAGVGFPDVKVDKEDCPEDADEILVYLTDLPVAPDAETEAVSTGLLEPVRTPDFPKRMFFAWFNVSSDDEDFLREGKV